jgi:aspartate aminotransferase
MDYDHFLAERVKVIKTSATIAVNEKAVRMRAQGIDVISFAVGEPDFDTPQNIKKAAIEAIESGFTKYTAVAGIVELKEAIAEKFHNDNGLTYKPSQISVACGAKHALYNIAQVLWDKGDEVIVIAPYWVSYTDQVILTGAAPVIFDTSKFENFAISRDELKALITPRTRAILINSPSNPTGKVYNRSELEIIAQLAVENDLLIISDEIYEKILYDDTEFVSIAALGNEIQQRTITVNGLSKAYAMTGWRVGYAAGPEKIIQAMNKIQGQSTSATNSIAQKASIAALCGPQTQVDNMCREYQKRRDFIINELNAIEGIDCNIPSGAFYAYPNVSKLYGSKYGDQVITDSVGFCAYILDETQVALVPGLAFGTDDFVRISYATSMENIKTGMARIKLAVEKLKGDK